MITIFLIVFAVVSAVHLASLFFKWEKIQNPTKILLAPLVLAVYVSAAREVYVPVVLALVFGWAGDVLLLKINEPRFFRLGLAGFLLGHICYIIAMIHFIAALHIPVLVISLTAALVLGVCMYRLVRPDSAMIPPVIAYEVTLLVMTLCALQLFIDVSSGALIFAGSLCFLVSDSLLAFFTFGKQPRYGQFLVMLTYIPAQFCIALGFCGL